MIKFGEVIGRAMKFISFDDKNELISIKSMNTGELIKIDKDAPEMFDLIKPLLLEYDHLLMERFLVDPKMTPGKIREHFLMQFNFILDSVSAELRLREKGSYKKNVKILRKS